MSLILESIHGDVCDIISTRAVYDIGTIRDLPIWFSVLSIYDIILSRVVLYRIHVIKVIGVLVNLFYEGQLIFLSFLVWEMIGKEDV